MLLTRGTWKDADEAWGRKSRFGTVDIIRYT
jgi:hypothetical protein